MLEVLKVGHHSYSEIVFRKIYPSGALDSILDKKQHIEEKEREGFPSDRF
jgi:hypothetical protein